MKKQATKEKLTEEEGLVQQAEKRLRERYTTGTYQNGKPLNYSKDFIAAVSEKIAVVSEKSSPLEELNFHKNVIGSDETGKGEVFRPLIVVAAYVEKENVEQLIKWNVRDSKSYEVKDSDARKKYEQTKEKICDIGKKLTGYTSYQDFEKDGGSGKVIEKNNVTFVVNVIENEEYNKKWKGSQSECDENKLVRDGHAAALKELAKVVEYDYVVVDKFESAENIQEALNLSKISENKAIIAAKADGFAIAVACASVIAKHLGYLYMEEVAAKYRLDEYEDFSQTGDFSAELRDQLWEKLDNPEMFFKKYVKKFQNVVTCLKEKQENFGALYDED